MKPIDYNALPFAELVAHFAEMDAVLNGAQVPKQAVMPNTDPNLEALLDEVNRRIEEAYQAGYDTGYANGYEAGYEFGSI